MAENRWSVALELSEGISGLWACVPLKRNKQKHGHIRQAADCIHLADLQAQMGITEHVSEGSHRPELLTPVSLSH